MILYIISIFAILMLIFFLVGLFYRFRYALRGEANDGRERRQDDRVPIKISAEIQADGCEPIHGQTRDLSPSGVFVVGGAALAKGVDCEIRLIMAGRNKPIRLSLRGRVARVNDEGMGVEFTAMNRECYDNLCYIIRYNQSGEAD